MSKITDFIGKMNGYYAQLKDMNAELPNEDKRVTLCSQMNVRFRELAKVFTACTLDIIYQQLCADLLLGDQNNQTLNLYEMNQTAGLSNTNCTISTRPTQRTNSRCGGGQAKAGSRETSNSCVSSEQP